MYQDKFTKLEIGPGEKPLHKDDPEWLLIDARKFPWVDIVCNASKLPQFENETFDEVYASGVIEHFGWRTTKAVLQEWLRILKKGGKLEMILPDYFFLWKNLITGRVLPKSAKWAGGPVTSAFVAYVTGGGQDYPDNTHYSHYCYDWYQETLEAMNCEVELRHHGQIHPSPLLRIIATKK